MSLLRSLPRWHALLRWGLRRVAVRGCWRRWWRPSAGRLLLLLLLVLVVHGWCVKALVGVGGIIVVEILIAVDARRVAAVWRAFHILASDVRLRGRPLR